MGRGDIKTKKGKICKGSYGNVRSRIDNKAVKVEKTTEKK
jgi:ribosomal small subunit protein bTHX